jgi:hypothetical protein
LLDMNKYKLRHRILKTMIRYLEIPQPEGFLEFYTHTELSIILKTDKMKVLSQLEYLRKQKEIEGEGEGLSMVYSANFDGYIAYWDDKYIDMLSDRRRVKWGARAAIASAILIIVLNVILLANYFFPNKVEPVAKSIIPTTEKVK